MFYSMGAPVTNLPRSGAIYALIEPSGGRVYVGRTRNLYNRVRRHLREARVSDEKRSCVYLYRAMARAKSPWTLCILEEVSPEEAIEDREAYWMGFFSSTETGLGFNLAAPTKEVVASPEYRARLSRAHKGKKKSKEHAKNIGRGHLGRKNPPISEETRRKLSEAGKRRVGSEDFAENLNKLIAANTGRVKSAEEREKIAAAHRGKRLTLEHREKLSKAKKGVPRGPRPIEVVEKIRQANLGKRRTPEQRAAMAAARKGVPLGTPSAECREKLSQKRKAWYAGLDQAAKDAIVAKRKATMLKKKQEKETQT